MIHTISFNLPEDKEALKLAQHGPAYYSVIWDLISELRTEAKYGENRSKTADEQRARLVEILDEHEVLGDF